MLLRIHCVMKASDWPMINKKALKIAIASGKGGTGKTLVSTNWFHVLKNNGHDVCLVDCDAEEPNVKVFFQCSLKESVVVTQKVPQINQDTCVFCGKCKEYCNYNAIFMIPDFKVIRVIEELCHDCGACIYACKNDAITEKEVSLGICSAFSVNQHIMIEGRVKTGVYSPVKVIQKAIKMAAGANIVIMDSPPGTSCPFIQTVLPSDLVVLVTEPTPFGLSDLKQSVETLKILKKKFAVIINRADLGNLDTEQYLSDNNIQVLMRLPFDRKIAEIYAKGGLITEVLPEYRDMFNELTDKIFSCYETA